MKLRSRIAAVSAAAAVTLAGLGALTTSPTALAAPATDLMISVYIEGSSNNKAIELHNPTSSPIDLADYTVELYSNGATTPNNTQTLTGSLEAGGHFTITNAQSVAALAAESDLTSNVTFFNGDDALVLKNSGTIIDSLGQVGLDPGTNWSANGVATSELTLTKKACTVDLDPTDAYDPSIDFAATAQDDFTTLGTVNCSGATPSPTPTASPTQTPDPTELLIGQVQGTTDVSPYAGQTVTVTGVVTGTFQGTEAGRDQFDGYYIQDSGDGNDETSDGIFIYDPDGDARTVGEEITVTGPASEQFNQTQISATTVTVLDTGVSVEPIELTVPVSNFERYEGMYVTFPQELTILEYFDFDRYGEIVYGLERQWTPTAVTEPGAAAMAIMAQNAANRIIVDDGYSSQNVSPAMHPNGEPFSEENYFRGGDTVAGLTGIMTFNFGEFKLQQTEGADHTAINLRPAVPEVGGDFRVASFNVLNYFTTLGMRGATTPLELDRQQAKIVAALAEIDADVVGLMEIQNNAPTAVQHLVNGLNAEVGAGTYSFIDTGVQGTDEIFQAIIYKTATAEPVGDFAVLDLGERNRPSLLQTFRHIQSGKLVSLSVNHLKSKGSACTPDDPDTGDGSGNCNLTRVEAAERIVEWIATDPTGQGSSRTIIMGDLNSYDYEDPIDVFIEAGYTDLEKKYNGEFAYSYVFDGQLGYLDYALANPAATADVVGTSSWHINADESDLFDYTMRFKADNEDALFSPDPYRSSDHDPVIIGLQLGATPTPTPTPTPSPNPTVTVTVTASPTPGKDLYETPGFHQSGGRMWMTVCEPYSITTRCWTYIWGTTVHESRGVFFEVNGWKFNNLTYLASPRSAWGDNPLANTGRWTATDARQWRTECDTAVSGGNGCRSYVVATQIERHEKGYVYVTKEIFNNIVRFS